MEGVGEGSPESVEEVDGALKMGSKIVGVGKPAVDAVAYRVKSDGAVVCKKVSVGSSCVNVGKNVVVGVGPLNLSGSMMKSEEKSAEARARTIKS